jgi:RNA polymerase sigma-B factor
MTATQIPTMIPTRLDIEAATDERLLIRYHRHGDVHARDEIIRRMIPLARRLAHRYRAGASIDDMTQVAAVGLVKAVDRFDPDRGVPFVSYAIPKIIGELKRHVRDHAWAVHVPRPLKDRAVSVERATRSLAAGLGRSPSIGELADELGLAPEHIVDAIAARRAIGSESLDTPRFNGEDGGIPFAETFGADDVGLDFDYAPGVNRLLRALPPLERVILHLRFAEDLTQAEIAERVGVSQMHVSRLIRRSLDRLRPAAERQAA